MVGILNRKQVVVFDVLLVEPGDIVKENRIAVAVKNFVVVCCQQGQSQAIIGRLIPESQIVFQAGLVLLKMVAYFEKGNIDVFLLEFAELLSGMFRQRIVQNVDFVLFIMGRMSNQRLQRNAQVRHVIFIRGEKNGDNRCLSHLFILIVV